MNNGVVKILGSQGHLGGQLVERPTLGFSAQVLVSGL